MSASSQTPSHHYLDLARHDWIFCVEPGESITEALQASLFEWSALRSHGVSGRPLRFFRVRAGADR